MNFDILQARQNFLLSKEEIDQVDRAVVEAFSQPLVFVRRLTENGLTVRIGGLGTMISTVTTISDMDGADVLMDFMADPQQEGVERNQISFPVPILQKGWSISKRQLEAARRGNINLDTTAAEQAARAVGRKLEQLAFTGFNVSGMTVYGLLNHPNRITGTAQGQFTTPLNAYKTTVDVLRLLSQANIYTGTVELFLNPAQYYTLLGLLPANNDRSELDAIRGLPRIGGVHETPDVPAGEMLAVVMSKSVLDLAVAQDIINVAVQTSELGQKVITFTAAVLRLKPDYYGKLGVVHITGC